MTIWNAILCLLAILLALVLLCAAVIFLERKFPSKKFDERQKAARGSAYRLSFLVGTVYYLVVLAVLLRQEHGPQTVAPYLLVFGGLELQVMVTHIYCILTHAAMPLSEKPGAAVAGYLFCGLLYLTMCDYTKPMPLVGAGSEAWVWLATMLSFFALAVMHIISLLRREKE